MNATDTITLAYRRRSNARMLFILAAILVMAVMAMVALCVGASGMRLADVVAALFADSGRAHGIVWMLRLPRIVLACLVGFGLGTAGAVFQAILRNPLASPYTLGVGSGAGFGAVTVIIFFSGMHRWAVAGGAFACAMLSAAVILAVARLRQASTETMILGGIAQMFLFSSLTSLFQYMGTMDQVHEIVFWFFGSLSKAGWPEIALVAVMVGGPLPYLLRRAWDFDLLTAGDESATALGIDVGRLRLRSVTAASLMTAGCICFAGVIGFIGLVAPHITRMIIGGDHRYLLPASGLIGAVVVLIADTLGRTLWSPHVLPIGIVTSFIGVPFFFYLLIKQKKAYW
ncbi:putative ABC transporter, permease protein [Desulfosarcina variabilis str. Montpellier]|uniref:FecCD family ABC transporter permease n=1 Tax=Desulfosarcina variabilis TaxID=2300 RepID=UPI003AFA14C7